MRSEICEIRNLSGVGLAVAVMVALVSAFLARACSERRTVTQVTVCACEALSVVRGDRITVELWCQPCLEVSP